MPRPGRGWGCTPSTAPRPSASWRTPPPTPTAPAGWPTSWRTWTATAGCWPSWSPSTCPAWLDCRELGLPEPGAFFLDRAGVALTDGLLCGLAGEQYVRLNVATPRPGLVQVVERMGAALAAG